MKKKVDLHLHHQIQEQLSIKNAATFFNRLRKLPVTLINLVIEASYQIGLLLISIIKAPSAIRNSLKNITWQGKNFSSLLGFLLLIVIALTPLGISYVVSSGQILTGRVLGISSELNKDASMAKESLQNQDFVSAQQNLVEVIASLEKMQQQFDDSNLVLQSIVNRSPKEFNSGNVIEAAKLLTESAQEGTKLLELIQGIKLSPEGMQATLQTTSVNPLSQIENSSKLISGKISQANQLLEPLQIQILPAELQMPLTEIKSLVKDLSIKTEALYKIARIGKMVMENNKFLILLQNNNELRATGGFIGTIAQGQFVNGSIKKLDIRSVYDLDGQLLETIKPPEPLMQVNGKLYLRDSNWFPDFAESAGLIRSMYEKEGGETPDLIIAITPDLFISLLELTGPITLPTYRVTINAQNFIETIQTSTSVAYDKNLNQPKQLLADLYPTLLQRLGDVSSENPTLFFEVLIKNLSQKNILISSRNSELQNYLDEFHWSGSLTQTQRDYLMVNSSNLSGTKTDRFLERGVEVNTTIDNNGSVINTIKYSVKNNLPSGEPFKNLSYIRFIVPMGSRLVASSGFTQTPTSPEVDFNYTEHSLVNNWQSKVSLDVSQKVIIGTESTYGFYGGWLEILPGDSKTVTVTYQLPFFLKSGTDNYSLLWQKQPGMLPFAYKHSLNFTGHNLLWSNLPTNSLNTAESVIKTDGLFNEDKFIGLVLEK